MGGWYGQAVNALDSGLSSSLTNPSWFGQYLPASDFRDGGLRVLCSGIAFVIGTKRKTGPHVLKQKPTNRTNDDSHKHAYAKDPTTEEQNAVLAKFLLIFPSALGIRRRGIITYVAFL